MEDASEEAVPDNYDLGQPLSNDSKGITVMSSHPVPVTAVLSSQTETPPPIKPPNPISPQRMEQEIVKAMEDVARKHARKAAKAAAQKQSAKLWTRSLVPTVPLPYDGEPFLILNGVRVPAFFDPNFGALMPIWPECIACNLRHPTGSCPLKLAGTERCPLCGIAHYGHARVCPHIKSETMVRLMLDDLKNSPERRDIVDAAVKYLRGVKGHLVMNKKRKKEAQEAGHIGATNDQGPLTNTSHGPVPPQLASQYQHTFKPINPGDHHTAEHSQPAVQSRPAEVEDRLLAALHQER